MFQDSLKHYRKFEELSAAGEKVGEYSLVQSIELAAKQAEVEDTSCGFAEEGQDANETKAPESISEKPSA